MPSTSSLFDPASRTIVSFGETLLSKDDDDDVNDDSLLPNGEGVCTMVALEDNDCVILEGSELLVIVSVELDSVIQMTRSVDGVEDESESVVREQFTVFPMSVLSRRVVELVKLDNCVTLGGLLFSEFKS